MRNEMELRSVLAAIARYRPQADERASIAMMALAIIDHPTEDRGVPGIDLGLRELVKAWPRKRAGRNSGRRYRSGFEHAEYATHRYLDVCAAEWRSLSRLPLIDPATCDRIIAGVTLVQRIGRKPVTGVEAVRLYARVVRIAQAAAFLAGRSRVSASEAQIAIIYAFGQCDWRRATLLEVLYGRAEPATTREVLRAAGVGNSNVSIPLRTLLASGVVEQLRGSGNIATRYVLVARTRELIHQALLPWQGPRSRELGF